MTKKESGVYRRRDNKFGWRIVAANGKVIAGDMGQGYSRRIDAEDMFSRFTYTEPSDE